MSSAVTASYKSSTKLSILITVDCVEHGVVRMFSIISLVITNPEYLGILTELYLS